MTMHKNVQHKTNETDILALPLPAQAPFAVSLVSLYNFSSTCHFSQTVFFFLSLGIIFVSQCCKF